ncbi:hypothetical protein OBBRIDRAFT_837556 [Obba rivulosa]|uniref:Uncharacterized protein n=1 Tax=Obba rivulosa TaxID=1052685 RepID=A0A8E2DHM1_9APHY|nr:hypothetical protein OBBRIDRAFT_837556 [Obba rivulosa]
MSSSEQTSSVESRPIDESSVEHIVVKDADLGGEVTDESQDADIVPAVPSPKPGSPIAGETSLPPFEQPDDAEAFGFRPRGRTAHPSAGVKVQPVRK